MVAGGEATPPPSSSSFPDGLGRGGLRAAPRYCEESWMLFVEKMGDAEERKELLDSKERDQRWVIGRNIARLIDDGCDFQHAIVQVRAKMASNQKGRPIIRDVEELVKCLMFPSSAAVAVPVWSGSRSAMEGGAVRSKHLKLEALAIHGFGGNSSQVSPLRSAGESSMGSVPVCADPSVVGIRCTTPVCDYAPVTDVSMELRMGARDGDDLASSAHKLAGEKGCTPPVCEFALEAAKSTLGEIGSSSQEVETRDSIRPGGLGEMQGSVDSADAEAISLQVCAPFLDATGAGEMIESVPAVPLKVKGDAADEQCIDCDVGIGLDGHGVNIAVALPMGGLPSCAVLMPTIQDHGCSEAVCCNAEVEMNPVAASLAKDYLPPAPGVGLQEWVRVAKDNRKGKKRGNKSAVEMGMIGVKAVVVEASTSADDPFPPLSRAPSDSAGTRLDSNIGSRGEVVSSIDVGKKFSWKELVRSTKPANVDVDLHFVEPTQIDGEPCAVFSVEEEVENMREWQHTLLCYVVGKSPSYYQFLKVVQRLWKAPGGIEVFLRENGLFYCRFSCEEDLRQVIKNGPWYMEGKLIVVKKFMGATNCEEDMLSSIPIWVKLPSLPVQWWSISGVSKVVSPIGYPLYFDVPSASQSRISYARCCVEVAMEKPLPDFVTCIGGDKVRRRQKISYDWVPKKCSNCKEFGHLVVDCYKTKNHVLHQTQMVGSKGKAKVGGQQPEVPICNGQKPVIENPIVNASHASSSYPLNLVVGGSIHAIQARGKHSYFLSDEEPKSGDDQSVESLHQVCDDEGEPKNEGVKGDSLSVSSSGDKEVGDFDDGISILPCDSEELVSKEIKEIESGNEDVAEPKTGSFHGGLDYMEDNMKEKKVKRIRKKPAPIRPVGSRITRHSGNIPTT